MVPLQRRTFLLGLAGLTLPCVAQWDPARNRTIAYTQTLSLNGGSLQIDLAAGSFDLPNTAIIGWVSNAAKAVAVYYGRFPVAHARVLILPAADQSGIMQGTTWGSVGGAQGFTRMRLGQHTPQSDLDDDWMITHELTHMAFPDLDDEHHWLEEGLATYIEPIARVQAGRLPAAKIWQDMMSGMPKGEPRSDDQGLDHTHTWGRTYWGGGLFCLMADITLRRQTHNKLGLQDALRAIVREGGTIDKDWPLDRTLQIGDRATGTTVLSDLYKQWANAPVTVDLADLWAKLGVHGNQLDPSAPWADIREAITAPRA